MLAFDSVFLDVARHESRAIHGVDSAGRPTDTFLFREFYCSEPRCDCRHVLIQVEWIEGKRVAATLDYAFEPPRRRDEPQLYLDPDFPQSEHAAWLLDVFADIVANDAVYRGHLLDHYAMWKQVVDDPKHPDRAKVRRGHAPTFTPAVRRPTKPPTKRSTRQARQVVPPAEAQGIQVLATNRAGMDSKVQQRFARLLKKVDQQKQRVRAWRDTQPAIQSKLAEAAALSETHQRVGYEIVQLLDRTYSNPGLTKADRKAIQAIICEIAEDLLLSGGYDDLKPIYNRHSRRDFDAEQASANAAGARALKSAMEEMFGVTFGDGDVNSLEELRDQTNAQIQALEQEESAARDRRATRKKTAKQAAKATQREAEQTQVGKALQDVFRKLAVALHPDLEQDPVERARKTTLMQEVNAAYEAKDLLQLLELQLRFEQVDPTKLDAIAEDRLRNYNTILEQQSKQLELELDELELPFRMEFDLSPSARLTPTEVLAVICADIDAQNQQTGALRRDLASFEDVARLKAWLKSSRRRTSRSSNLDLFG